MLVLSVLHTGRVFARIAPRSRTCHVPSCRPRDAACCHYLVHQRHRDGVQPLPADTSPPIRQLFRHHAEHQNPVGSKRFGTFCHRRRQNGTGTPSPSAGRNTYTPSYSVHMLVYRLFCQGDVLPVLVSLFQTTADSHLKCNFPNRKRPVCGSIRPFLQERLP